MKIVNVNRILCRSCYIHIYQDQHSYKVNTAPNMELPSVNSVSKSLDHVSNGT